MWSLMVDSGVGGDNEQVVGVVMNMGVNEEDVCDVTHSIEIVNVNREMMNTALYSKGYILFRYLRTWTERRVLAVSERRQSKKL